MPLFNFIYSMMGQLISKYEPFRQEVSVEFQVTVKALGPLVLDKLLLYDQTLIENHFIGGYEINNVR